MKTITLTLTNHDPILINSANIEAVKSLDGQTVVILVSGYKHIVKESMEAVAAMINATQP